MKVIIPVAGAGAKLRPFTYTQPKCLIPLAGKTILSFIVDELIEAGANDFIFIIGHLGEKIKDYVIELTCEISVPPTPSGFNDASNNGGILLCKYSGVMKSNK